MKYLLPLLFVLACSDIGTDTDTDIAYAAEPLELYTTSTIISEDIYDGVADAVGQYATDIQIEGFSTHVVVYSAPDDLVEIIEEEKALGVEGVFLIGNFPAYWYETETEQFPTDIYLMCLDATWTDADTDGRFDAHTRLTPDIYVSRLIGTAPQINSYFSKIHDYRNGSDVGDSASVFKDDPWFNYQPANLYALDGLFMDVDICISTECTTRENYLFSTVQDYVYVYQFMHATASRLSFVEGDESLKASLSLINAAAPKALFYNMFNCSSARFTQSNLGMNYLMNSEAIAVVGPTKTGGMFDAKIFHQDLATMAWGPAFRHWYAVQGYSIDGYCLGMSIMGDPLLKIPRG